MATRVPRYFESLYINLVTHPRSRDWPVAKIHEEANREIEKLNSDLKPPSLPWAYKFVAEIRHKSNEPGWFDEAWSLGALSEPLVDIPHDAIPDITDVWKLCMVGGRTLTIRQAIWIARTRHLIAEFETPQKTTEVRYLVASMYADEEKSAAIGGHPMDTSYLDGALIYGLSAGSDAPDGHVYHWVRRLLRDLGELPKEGLALIDALPEDETLAFIELMERISIYSPQVETQLARIIMQIDGEMLGPDLASQTELFSPIRKQAIALGLRFAIQKKGIEYLSGELFSGLVFALKNDDLKAFNKLIGMVEEDE